MKSVKYYCDHCGKELNPMIDYIEFKWEISHKWAKQSLCEECFEALISMVDVFCGWKGE